uniref:DNA replication complex GINS protein PSF1 n=1 Tax=Plectus sambesii TaxID=2011161 RepID=A0A914UW16_9BILA
MLGEQALNLIKELERNPDIIPPYNDDLMKRCIEEIKTLYQQNINSLAELNAGRVGAEHASLLQARHAAIERTKRCMLAYIYHRQQRLKRYRWDYGGVLPSTIKVCLCEAEVRWFHEYCKNLADFQSGLGESGSCGVDLTVNMEPPKSLFVQVMCVKDYDEFETSDGTRYLLKKNSLV